MRWALKIGSGLLIAIACLAALGHGRAAVAFVSPAPAAHCGTLHAQFALFADFDGDHKPDLAVLRVDRFSSSKTQYSIVFSLSAGNQRTVEITEPFGGLLISSRDVNGDNTPDLIVTSVRRPQPVAIFLNDGLGNFTPADPAGYPAALQQTDAELRPATAPVESGAVLPGTKNFPAEPAEGGSLKSPKRFPGPLFLTVLRTPDHLFRSNFSDRAPPSLEINS